MQCIFSLFEYICTEQSWNDVYRERILNGNSNFSKPPFLSAELMLIVDELRKERTQERFCEVTGMSGTVEKLIRRSSRGVN
jgi:hypothetical protein